MNKDAILVTPSRVAVYMRFQSSEPQTMDCLQMQRTHYSGLINHNPAWAPAGIYTDFGGDRNRFYSMIEDALAGRIDIIVARSFTRFCRDVSGCLRVIRLLREHGVAVFFEAEGIDTLDEHFPCIENLLSGIEKGGFIHEP